MIPLRTAIGPRGQQSSQHVGNPVRSHLDSIFMAYCGSMTFSPGTQSKWRLLNVATSLLRSNAVAATMTSGANRFPPPPIVPKSGHVRGRSARYREHGQRPAPTVLQAPGLCAPVARSTRCQSSATVMAANLLVVGGRLSSQRFKSKIPFSPRMITSASRIIAICQAGLGGFRVRFATHRARHEPLQPTTPLCSRHPPNRVPCSVFHCPARSGPFAHFPKRASLRCRPQWSQFSQFSEEEIPLLGS